VHVPPGPHRRQTVIPYPRGLTHSCKSESRRSYRLFSPHLCLPRLYWKRTFLQNSLVETVVECCISSEVHHVPLDQIDQSHQPRIAERMQETDQQDINGDQQRRHNTPTSHRAQPKHAEQMDANEQAQQQQVRNLRNLPREVVDTSSIQLETSTCGYVTASASHAEPFVDLFFDLRLFTATQKWQL
jgi:hypothetical protein